MGHTQSSHDVKENGLVNSNVVVEESEYNVTKDVKIMLYIIVVLMVIQLLLRLAKDHRKSVKKQIRRNLATSVANITESCLLLLRVQGCALMQTVNEDLNLKLITLKEDIISQSKRALKKSVPKNESVRRDIRDQLVRIFNEFTTTLEKSWHSLDELEKNICNHQFQKVRDKVIRSFEALNVKYKVPFSCIKVIDPLILEEDIVEEILDENPTIMATTAVDFFNLASKLIPTQFDGSADKLASFLDSLELLKTVSANQENNAVAFIKTRLVGKARDLITNEASIDTIINKLKSNIKGESSRSLTAKLTNLKQKNKDAASYASEIESLADKLQRAYLTEGVPNAVAESYTVETTVRSLSQNANNEKTRLVMEADTFTTVQDAFASNCCATNLRRPIDATPARLRPQRSKYSVIWDPQKVLTHLASYVPNEQLPLEKLSCKLATLLALITSHRMETLSLIRIKNIIISEDGIQIVITDPIKTSLSYPHQPCLHIPFFLERSEVCMASTLCDYIEISSSLREEEEFLFIITRPPYKRASSGTISRWIKKTLTNAGIDTKIFTAYSTRHASTSTAYRQGVSLDLIRRTAGWTEKSKVLSKFYNRPLIENNLFAKVVLNAIE
ncbi:hypothetical protein NQ315_008877 [Exocentrus adspersus]|uniref:Tyr recombinase domain-containing protein n=1 Tax=Exocentrus adspersus TaxID=1586481 RepID=A0AAV8V5C7_9CUCU|nr:hypothetical protein NQ315_008877 [Exocentrus adspersus]